MIQTMLSWLDDSRCAQIALLIFFVVFVVVSLRTLATSRQVTDRNARLALTDQPGNENDE